MTKIESILKYLNWNSVKDKTVIKLANQLLEDDKKPLVKTREEAINFFEQWLPTIDEEWINQINDTCTKGYTFDDPFCNNGSGR
jgi:hypothetical protein